jgi:hypothetical protein
MFQIKKVSCRKRKTEVVYTKCRSHYAGSCKQARPNSGATHLALPEGALKEVEAISISVRNQNLLMGMNVSKTT